MAPKRVNSGSKEARLKAALWYSTGQTADAIAVDESLNATQQFIGGLNEMLWAQIETATRDLESFANHAGRSTIRTEDVLLLARRNEGLKATLRQSADAVKQPDAKR